MPSKADFTAAMKSHLESARAITDRVERENRDYTTAERDQVNDLIARAKSAKAGIEQAKRGEAKTRQVNGDQAVRDTIRSLTAGASEAPPEWSIRGKARDGEWAKSTATHVAAVNSAQGRKAVVSGQYEVGSVLQPGIDRLPDYPTRLLDLLVNRRPLTEGNVFGYLKQTARTHNAAPVADNATKPVSVYSFGEVEDRVRVVAHLSEPIPLRLLSDIVELREFLVSEMEEGLKRAVEEQVLSGDGTGENMRGLLQTSGVAVQAWSNSLLETLRKAATTLEVAGEVPTAWAIHPTDVETLDLLTDDNARHYFQGPSQQLGQSAPVWSLPIVRSVAVPAGTAILGDWSRLQLVVREDSQLDVDTSGDLFKKNQAQMRLEGRYGNALLRPSAFCEVATSNL